MLAVNLEFPHSYEISEVPELPGTGKFPFPVYHYPRPTSRGERDGLWVKVQPNSGDPWFGVFAFDHDNFYTGIVSTPDPDRLCVISRGAAYIVSASDPEHWEMVDLPSISAPLAALDHRLLIFPFFDRLSAYGLHGLVWRSPRVCWDDLKIEKITADTIEGTGYDPTSKSGEMVFAVDIRTGRSLINPPKADDGSSVW